MPGWKLGLALSFVLVLTAAGRRGVRGASGDGDGEDELVAKWKDMEASMRELVQGALKKTLPEVLRMGQGDGGLSAPCTSAFIGVFRRLGSLDKEVMKMIDSSGKLAPGLLDGSLADFGDYEECLSVAVPDSSSEDGSLLFRGQYCMVKSRPPLPPKPRFVNKHFAAVNLTLFPENSVSSFSASCVVTAEGRRKPLAFVISPRAEYATDARFTCFLFDLHVSSKKAACLD
ncbi:hypothetical protein V5799_025286 [Amblyomma americanum]|uniref:Nose resistant-to-fluoxetine protein N-terminal domain-containing protein n=1 Tax=Amblyomma americanum TaxID=6943 RepID=A0AAQ4E9P8_AMBAM